MGIQSCFQIFYLQKIFLMSPLEYLPPERHLLNVRSAHWRFSNEFYGNIMQGTGQTGVFCNVTCRLLNSMLQNFSTDTWEILYNLLYFQHRGTVSFSWVRKDDSKFTKTCCSKTCCYKPILCWCLCQGTAKMHCTAVPKYLLFFQEAWFPRKFPTGPGGPYGITWISTSSTGSAHLSSPSRTAFRKYRGNRIWQKSLTPPFPDLNTHPPDTLPPLSFPFPYPKNTSLLLGGQLTVIGSCHLFKWCRDQTLTIGSVP